MFNFHKHKWSKWKEIKRMEVVAEITNSIIGYCLHQERECLECGYKEIKLKKVTI